MRIASLSAACAGLALAASLALAHPPGHQAQKAQPAPAARTKSEVPGPPGRNLKVLPADIPQERLILVMQGWGRALGVQCSHCHVPGNFASDANPHKQVARGMVTMTKRINNELLPPVVGAAQAARVTCHSCHQGSPIPETQPPAPPPAPAAPAQPQPDRPREPLPAHIAPDTPARPY